MIKTIDWLIAIWRVRRFVKKNRYGGPEVFTFGSILRKSENLSDSYGYLLYITNKDVTNALKSIKRPRKIKKYKTNKRRKRRKKC